MSKFNKKDLILLIILSSLFFTLSMVNLKNAGSNSDETMNVLWGPVILRNLQMGDQSHVHIRIFGLSIPTDVHRPYMFSLPNYMAVPFYMVFGISLFSFKFMGIFVIWGSIIFFYLTFKAAFNRFVAFMTLLFLTTSPLFLHYAKIPFNVYEPFINFFYIGGVYFFIRFMHKKKNKYLFLVAFLFGCGLSIKLSAAARIAGILLASICVYRKSILNVLNKITKIQLAGLILFFSAGSFPFLYYNAASGGKTFKLMSFIGKTTEEGTDNSNIVGNLIIRAEHIAQIIREHINAAAYTNLINGSRTVFPRGLLLILFICSFILLILLVVRKRKDRRKITFIYIVFTIMFICSIFSPSSLSVDHMSLIYPFPQFIFAYLIYRLYKSWGKYWLALIMLPLAINLNVLYFYHKTLHETGGNGYWSRYIPVLTEYVKTSDISPLFGMCNGLQGTIPIVTAGEMYIDDFLYGPSTFHPIEYFEETVHDLMIKHEKYYVLGMPMESEIDHEKKMEIVRKQAALFKREVRVEKIIYNRIDDPVYAIYRIE
ncbi:ArnT family glycosyltransferase [Elusimicrobiota bacterium]